MLHADTTDRTVQRLIAEALAGARPRRYCRQAVDELCWRLIEKGTLSRDEYELVGWIGWINSRRRRLKPHLLADLQALAEKHGPVCPPESGA